MSTEVWRLHLTDGATLEVPAEGVVGFVPTVTQVVCVRTPDGTTWWLPWQSIRAVEVVQARNPDEDGTTGGGDTDE